MSHKRDRGTFGYAARAQVPGASLPASNTGALDFCGFRFSARALRSSYRLALDEDASHETTTATCAVEELGRAYLDAPDTNAALNFSRAVCIWGRGQCVWGSLQRFHGGQLGGLLHDWLREASHARGDEAAIAPALPSNDPGVDAGIKGLGISFTSKHLRMLEPQSFAVLDSVLSRGLGFALNIKGYALLMHELRRFVAALPSNALGDALPTIAAVESGIFGLVRQVVRSRGRLTCADSHTGSSPC